MAAYGIYRGAVSNNSDPENLGRLKAVIPQLMGQNESAWAWPAQPNISGVVSLAIGDPGWILFEDGQTDHPVWVGTWLMPGEVLDPLPVPSADFGTPIASRIGDTNAPGVGTTSARADHRHGRQEDMLYHWMTRLS